MVPGDRPVHLRTPGGGRRPGPVRAARRTARPRPGQADRGGGAGYCRRCRQGKAGHAVHRPGRAATGHGPAAARGLPGVRPRAGGGVRRLRRAPRPSVARRRVRRARHGRSADAERDRIRPAGAVRPRGRVVPADRVLGCAAGLPRRALDRRAVGGARRRGAVTGRCGRAGRRPRPADAGPARHRRDGVGGGRRNRGRRAAGRSRRTRRRGRHRRRERPGGHGDLR